MFNGGTGGRRRVKLDVEPVLLFAVAVDEDALLLLRLKLLGRWGKKVR